MDNILLQDDGDFEIIIENAAETDEGFGGEITSFDGCETDNNESAFFTFEEQYKQMIQMQLGGLFKEYCDYKANSNFIERNYYSVNQSVNFKNLQRDTLKEFDLLRKINQKKVSGEKKGVKKIQRLSAAIKLTEPDIQDPEFQQDNSLINVRSNQFDMLELQQIRARTISRQEESQRLNKLQHKTSGPGGPSQRRGLKLRHNIALESINEQ